MAVFLILIITMSIRIGFMDSYIHNRRKFIGEESINIFIYTVGSAFYMCLTLKGVNGAYDNLKVIPMLLVLFLYIFFMYMSTIAMKVKKEREKKKGFYKTMEYVSLVILICFFPLLMIYPLIDIAIAFLYDFESKEII